MTLNMDAAAVARFEERLVLLIRFVDEQVVEFDARCPGCKEKGHHDEDCWLLVALAEADAP